MVSPKTNVKYSDEFKSMIISKANELIRFGLKDGILDEKTLGGIKFFIDKSSCLVYV